MNNKIIDKEIEKLGFEWRSKGEDTVNYTLYFNEEARSIEEVSDDALLLSIDMNDEVRISKWKDYENVLFEGVVKDITELKQVLTKLKIDYTNSDEKYLLAGEVVNYFNITVCDYLHSIGRGCDYTRFTIKSIDDINNAFSYTKALLTLDKELMLEYWDNEDDFYMKEEWKQKDLEYIDKYKSKDNE